jgi:hypothetical protein
MSRAANLAGGAIANERSIVSVISRRFNPTAAVATRMMRATH